ncbi:DEAD/DEAH box helicase [Mycoplasmopsis hyopharyngis]|uniref:DEAD/DEAH box helicase n=1 Tax=Mycoplasmopsis hyopharyngis TaxID=29558 RepID=UPI003872E365
MKKVNEQYQVILDNLLDVAPNDAAIFTKINNKYAFDFKRIFGDQAFNYIYTQKDFNMPVLEVNLIRLIEQLNDCNELEEFKDILMQNSYEISDFLFNSLSKDFENAKYKIINDIKLNYQKQSLKWKIFVNKAKEINNETNIWPMNLGFLFVKLSIDGKSIYGPLFFKEVYMEIRNSRPFLISNGEIKANEKLMFLLKNAGFDLTISDNYSHFSIEEMTKFVYQEWKEVYSCHNDINDYFQKIFPESITNETIEFNKGIVLGLFQPLGGYVRNRMMQILENNEIHSILDVEFNKNIYKNKIKDAILNPKTSIFKITPTNLSQDKAIASSLNQNTIIWGPPGTGKSQTIVNILTNILVYKKTALVCSQKKAALEVIRNRMGDLNRFCLFMLNSKNMNRKNFYVPIREYLEFLENYDNSSKIEPLNIITKKEIDFVQNIKTYSSDPRFDEVSKYIFDLQQVWQDFDVELWKKLLHLPRNLKYVEPILFDSSKSFIKGWLKANKLRFRFLNHNNWRIKSLGYDVFNAFKKMTFNIQNVVSNLHKTTDQDFEYITNLLNILPDWQRTDISDIEALKNFVAKNIIDKISNFTKEEKQEYIEFAASIRLANLEPYKFIKRFSKMIKIFFPVLIVTPDADLSAWEKEEFDYAIMDESSQIFLEKGLPVLYLAKTKILAGDDKQMKPSNWFGIRQNDDSIYGKVDSLLDFATSLGVYSILLDKNYRSNYASLMTFSSKYFYKSSLDVIDTFHNEKIEPIDVIEVNGVWENNKNEIEIDKVIEITLNNLELYKKIILLSFNAKQQDAILDKIFANYPELEKAIEDNRLLLRNIENIQGDEADLVIMSVAYDRNTQIHSTYVGRPGGMNALNVAISRAKDKMIVVKSLRANQLILTTDNEDSKMFKNWLQFLEMNSKTRQDFLNIEQATISQKTMEIQLDSKLNDDVKNFLTNLVAKNSNLTLGINESIGTLKIDYLIKRNDAVLVCFIVDEYKYANDLEAFLSFNDLIKFIKNKGYTVYRLDKINFEKYHYEIEQLVKTLNSQNEPKPIFKTKEIPLEGLELDKQEEIQIDIIPQNIDDEKSFEETTKEWKIKLNEFTSSDQEK